MLGKFGRLPDTLAHREYDKARMLRAPGAEQLASVLEVDAYEGLVMPSPPNQLQLGACVGNTGARQRRGLALRFPKYSSPDIDLSRLWLYYQCRKLDGDPSQDGGTTGHSVFEVLSTLGCPPETDDPYDIANFADPTINDNSAFLPDAALYKIGPGAFHRIADPYSVVSCLASKYAVAIGFPVFESFEGIGSDGIMPMPKSSESIIGGHETNIRISSASRKAFGVENWWGTDWGATINGTPGMFWMPWDFVISYLDQIDLMMCHLGKSW